MKKDIYLKMKSEIDNNPWEKNKKPVAIIDLDDVIVDFLIKINNFRIFKFLNFKKKLLLKFKKKRILLEYIECNKIL